MSGRATARSAAASAPIDNSSGVGTGPISVEIKSDLGLTTADAAEGKFAGVTSVQRVATRGGVEPAARCDASNAGKELRVPYTADYYFYKRK